MMNHHLAGFIRLRMFIMVRSSNSCTINKLDAGVAPQEIPLPHNFLIIVIELMSQLYP
jgi:hypothetical protein